MHPVAPWLLRVGALMILLSPLLPQAQSGAERYGALRVRRELAARATRIERLAVDVGFFLPSLIALALLAASTKAGLPVLRAPSLGLFLLLAFALSTLGSLLLTDPGGSARPPPTSFLLALSLFVAPLLLAGVAVARGLEKGLGGPPPVLERLSFALLLGLHGLFLADSGWALLVSWTGTQVPVKLLGGAAVEPLGAALLVVGGSFSSGRPRAAVDTASSSG